SVSHRKLLSPTISSAAFIVGSSPRKATKKLLLKYSVGRLLKYSCSELPLKSQCCSIRCSQYGTHPPSASTCTTRNFGNFSITPYQMRPAIAAIASNGCDRMCPVTCVSIRSPNDSTDAEPESWVEIGRPSFSTSAQSGR